MKSKTFLTLGFLLAIAFLGQGLRADECERMLKDLRDRYNITTDDQLKSSVNEALNWSFEEVLKKSNEQHAGAKAIIKGVPAAGSWDRRLESFNRRKEELNRMYNEALETHNYSNIQADILSPSAAEIYRLCKAGKLGAVTSYIVGNERGEFVVWLSFSDKVDGNMHLPKSLTVEEFAFGGNVKLVGGTLRKGAKIKKGTELYGVFHRNHHGSEAISLQVTGYDTMRLSLEALPPMEEIVFTLGGKETSLRIPISPNNDFTAGFSYDVKGEMKLEKSGTSSAVVFRVEATFSEAPGGDGSGGTVNEGVVYYDNITSEKDPQGVEVHLIGVPTLRLTGVERAKGAGNPHPFSGRHPHATGSYKVGTLDADEFGVLRFSTEQFQARKTWPVVLPEGISPSAKPIDPAGKPDGALKRFWNWLTS